MLHKVIEILISLMILIPVFWVLNKVRFHNTKETMGYFVFAVYLAAVYLFVGMPTLQFMRFDLSFTYLPFLPMIADLKNTILNVFLFVPMGFLLPFLWKRYTGLTGTLLFGFRMSFAIELLQIFTYRATDINDLIANTLGTALGYCLFRGISRVIPSASKFSQEENQVICVLFSVFVPMFFIQPYLAGLYYKLIF